MSPPPPPRSLFYACLVNGADTGSCRRRVVDPRRRRPTRVAAVFHARFRGQVGSLPSLPVKRIVPIGCARPPFSAFHDARSGVNEGRDGIPSSTPAVGMRTACDPRPRKYKQIVFEKQMFTRRVIADRRYITTIDDDHNYTRPVLPSTTARENAIAVCVCVL